MWETSWPNVNDFSCGFQLKCSSGTRSSILRVLAISCSNSPTIGFYDTHGFLSVGLIA